MGAKRLAPLIFAFSTAVIALAPGCESGTSDTTLVAAVKKPPTPKPTNAPASGGTALTGGISVGSTSSPGATPTPVPVSSGGTVASPGPSSSPGATASPGATSGPTASPTPSQTPAVTTVTSFVVNSPFNSTSLKIGVAPPGGATPIAPTTGIVAVKMSLNNFQNGQPSDITYSSNATASAIVTGAVLNNGNIDLTIAAGSTSGQAVITVTSNLLRLDGSRPTVTFNVDVSNLGDVDLTVQ